MFRIANGAFSGNEELHKIATECITNTFKSYLEDYFFLRDYKNEPNETLYTKVDVSELEYLLPSSLMEEMINCDIDYELFLSKKIAEFMIILNSKKEITPDVFIEYLIYRMIITTSEYDFYEISDKATYYRKQLQKPLYDYALDYITSTEFSSFEDENGHMFYENSFGEEISEDEYNTLVKASVDEMVEHYIENLTDISAMSIDDDSLVFWDWDFMFIDDWGFENTLKRLNSGCVAVMTGYGEHYIDDVFSNIDMDKPDFLD